MRNLEATKEYPWIVIINIIIIIALEKELGANKTEETARNVMKTTYS